MSGRKTPVDRLLASLIVILLSPIIFIGIPTRLAFNEWFIDWEYSKVSFPKDRYGMEDEYRKYLAKLGLRAVLSDEGMEDFKRAKLPDGRRAFREKEIRHMEDVKNFLGFFFPLVYISSFLSLLCLIYLRDFRMVGKTLALSSLFTLCLTLLIGGFSVTNYELAFELFHNYVFDPYSWKFNYTDTLLRIYPMKFWYDGTLFVLASAGMLCLFSLLLGFLLLRYRR
ncbi:integral membrane protein (TIGR01906 family) [Hydrogenivirga caldilitoris]|uniref:Integral membrane protein (TIGR01906 family) n=1 Tax=Hydrogenivirga caldilitoris TaxID=246264 RepID=A0A497XUU8_9AQUI|nr:TIGR01906 family membrane protein [Hydrogenivirga caldilitoris]RLJ70922.1 integral membrane protein (TIGR01906 family) [Hydrogenivirga caldilitoris]